MAFFLSNEVNLRAKNGMMFHQLCPWHKQMFPLAYFSTYWILNEYFFISDISAKWFHHHGVLIVVWRHILFRDKGQMVSETILFRISVRYGDSIIVYRLKTIGLMEMLCEFVCYKKIHSIVRRSIKINQRNKAIYVIKWWCWTSSKTFESAFIAFVILI